MLKRTHLALGVAVGLFMLPHVNNKLIFLPIVLLASLLPDVDSGFSSLGKRWFMKPVQWFVKHRGVFHSLTFAILVSLVIAFFWPVGALPFFLGYSFHLLADSFTPDGIKAFWPLKFVSKGRIKTGGRIEDGIFLVFLVLDVLLLVGAFF